MLDPKEASVPELKRFHRESFNIDELFSAAANLKYTSAIRQRLDALLKDPSDEFLRLLVRDVYTGMLTQKALGQFKPIVKRAITQYVNDTINERLSSAMQKNEAESQAGASSARTESPTKTPSRTSAYSSMTVPGVGYVASILRATDGT